MPQQPDTAPELPPGFYRGNVGDRTWAHTELTAVWDGTAWGWVPTVTLGDEGDTDERAHRRTGA